LAGFEVITETVVNICYIDALSTAIANRLRRSLKRACSVVARWLCNTWRCGAMTLAWLAFFCLVSSPCRAEIPDVL
jgi:hypothetical protein